MQLETSIAEADRGGCAFIVDGSSEIAARSCAAPCRPGSPYCVLHHARCRVIGGSVEECRRLREIEALAEAVGGRQGSGADHPSKALLRRLERAARAALRPGCSRIVQDKT
jgi:hypothetical protein